MSGIIFILFSLFSVYNAEKVLMTEVFAINVDPTLFNWTFEGINDQFVYQPSLLNAPDLPLWINYVYSERHHSGYLYGVPPHVHKEVKIDIIALNRQNYETRRLIFPIQITEKLNPAKHEVQMKIDNLNVEDMFDVERMERLKDIFRRKLWKDSQNDLYVTFLSSAVRLGARLPLKPNEGEGVVLRIGSTAPLSNELIELQDEVKPLWRVPLCPRDFKRTTVERIFRENGFELDWCKFRLLEDKIDNEELVKKGSEDVILDKWDSIKISEVPVRSYIYDLFCVFIIPSLLLIILFILLSIILCIQYKNIHDTLSEDFLDNIFHICTDYFSRNNQSDQFIETMTANSTLSTPKPTHTLRSIANQTDINCFSSDNVLLSTSHTNSPNNTVNRGVHYRPSPPPYVKPKNKQNF